MFMGGVMFLFKQGCKFNKAFTLAEVLITLMIIGVVASLTIPTLIQNIQDAHLKVAFKKEYSIIAQATDMIIVDKSRIISDSTTDDSFANLYSSYLKNIKTCLNSTTIGNCWNKDNTWKSLHGDPQVSDDNDAGMILTDGTFLSMDLDSSNNCTGDYTDTNYYPAGSFLACGYILVDVNGFKGPNVIGKDIYRIWVMEDGIKPGGTALASQNIEHHPCTTSHTGWACAITALQN